MAIVSAAVAAVSAAIATTTVATVSAAVVAVANVVAVVGLAVTAVGMITGNKGLLEAGKIMGYVGMAGNVAGWGVGSFAEGAKAFSARIGALYTKAWNEGVGGLFSGAKTGAAPAPAASTTQTNTVAPPGAASPGGAPAGSATPPATQAPSGAAGATPGSATAPVSPGGTQPTIMPTAVEQTAAPRVPNMGADQWGVEVGKKTTEEASKGWAGLLNNPLVPLTLAQGVGGAAGGWFEAAATEEQIEMQKNIEERNRRQQALINENNAFAPLIAFEGPNSLMTPGGLLNTRNA